MDRKLAKLEAELRAHVNETKSQTERLTQALFRLTQEHRDSPLNEKLGELARAIDERLDRLEQLEKRAVGGTQDVESALARLREAYLRLEVRLRELEAAFSAPARKGSAPAAPSARGPTRTRSRRAR
jgi:chromosome segregation ATPase